jgi:4-hydroxybutyrate CoA-transferase
MPRPLRPDQLPGLLRPGQQVFIQGATGAPEALLAALAAAPEACAGVRFIGVPIPGLNRFDPAALHPGASFAGPFLTPELAASFAAGRVRLLPLSYHGMWRHLAQAALDLALIQVTPPDAAGQCSLGLSVDFLPAVLARARLVVAEVNAAMPRPVHGVSVPYDRLDHVVEAAHPLPSPAGGERAAALAGRIAGLVASLVRDGDCLQVGIGKLPAAVLGALHGHRALGFHGGFVTDGVAALAEAGALTGRQKPIDAGMIVAGTVIGSPALFDWAAASPALRLAPVGYTHDIRAIAALDRFVAINAVLAVDLFAQANAEMVGGRQVSGVGGLADFVRGAALAEHGRSILVLPASAAGGTVSRIRAVFGADEIASCARCDADYVVTEHGIAALRDRSLEERAEALIGVADPAFQADLAAVWAKLRTRR